MSLRNIGVEFANSSHALVSITGDWIAHLLDYKKDRKMCYKYIYYIYR